MIEIKDMNVLLIPKLVKDFPPDSAVAICPRTCRLLAQKLPTSAHCPEELLRNEEAKQVLQGPVQDKAPGKRQ